MLCLAFFQRVLDVGLEFFVCEPAVPNVSIQGRAGGEFQDQIIVGSILKRLELHFMTFVQLQIENTEPVQLKPDAVGNRAFDTIDDGTIGLRRLFPGHIVLRRNPIDKLLHSHRIVSLRHGLSFLSIETEDYVSFCGNPVSYYTESFTHCQRIYAITMAFMAVLSVCLQSGHDLFTVCLQLRHFRGQFRHEAVA